LQVTDWASYPPGQPWSHAAVPAGTFASIRDYAIKQWGGLLRDYQAVRLRMFVEQAADDAAANASNVDIVKVVARFKARQVAWANAGWNETWLPAVPVGDTVAISRQLQQKARERGWRVPRAARPSDIVVKE